MAAIQSKHHPLDPPRQPCYNSFGNPVHERLGKERTAVHRAGRTAERLHEARATAQEQCRGLELCHSDKGRAGKRHDDVNNG